MIALPLGAIVALLQVTPAVAGKNVLFIAIDDLRPELGCYGASHIQSPNIDRLARDGVLFERAYCQVAVCNPSRNSLLSGLRPDTTRSLDNRVYLRQTLPDVLTLPQLFKDAGHVALSLGKIFHHSEREPGNDPLSWSEPFWQPPANGRHWFTAESHELIDRIRRLPEKARPRLVRGPPFEAADQPDDLYPDGQTALEAIATLRRLKADGKRFFLAVGFIKPHLPFTCPKRYWDLYPPDSVRLAPNRSRPTAAPNAAFHDWYELRTYATVPPSGDLPDDLARNLTRGYRACTSFVDAQVGRVLDELQRLGLRDDTIVALWGDHGYHLGENGVWTKMTNFERGTRVPLILRVPGARATGARTRALVELVDLYPTLAELCGLTPPPSIEGTSLVPLLDDPARPWKNAVFSQYLRPGKPPVSGRAIRTNEWRYVEWREPDGRLVGAELYDQEADPEERANVVADPRHATPLEGLRRRLETGWRSAAPPSPDRAAAPRRDGDGRSDVPLAMFEGEDLDGWTRDGDAFSPAPFRPGPGKRLADFQGTGVAWSGHGGVESVGALLSPEFVVTRRFLNFRVAGARDLPSILGVELLVDGRVARANAASEAFDPRRALYPRAFDVAEFEGRTARVRINDRSASGSIALDAVALGDTAIAPPSDASVPMRETHRPQFHHSAPTGWLNDANGLLHYRGRWHLFHQHRPPASPTTVWGHASSDDLLHWRQLPTAIGGDGVDSIFSGSGLVDRANASGLRRGEHDPILLFYTLHPPTGSGRRSTQCMAYSIDGARSFEAAPHNPILQTRDSTDRDPKVFFHPPARAWFLLLSLARNNTGRDAATYGLFRSRDLRSWQLIQEIGPGPWYWECPDMFPLPLDGDHARQRWILMKGSGDYIVGAFDGERFLPETDVVRVHWGASFYGAQTFSDAPDDRRIQIGWMPSGKERAPNAWPGMPFNQQMSFPRALTLRTTPEGPRVFREPIAEIANLYGRAHDLGPRPIRPGENPLGAIAHDLLDIDLELEVDRATRITLRLRGEEIVYDPRKETLTAFGRALAWPTLQGALVLRLLLDRTSIELFGNGGALTHSGVFFPRPRARAVSLAVEGGPARARRLVARELRSIHP